MGNKALKAIQNAKDQPQLDLNSMGLSELPPEIGISRLIAGSLDSLTKLNLSINKLKSLPPQVGNLVNLTSLNLYNNQIKVGDPLLTLQELPQEITALADLEVLNLSVNLLEETPRGFGGSF